MVQESFCAEILHTKWTGHFFLARDEADGPGLQRRDLSNSQMGTFPKVHFYIVNCVKIIWKQGKIVKPTCCNCPQWILFFFKYNPSNLSREATPVTLAMIRSVKMMIYDVKALHMAFLGILGTIFWGSLKNPKNFILKKLSYSIELPSAMQKSHPNEEKNRFDISWGHYWPSCGFSGLL